MKMFEQIHPLVQRSLFRKIESLDRKSLGDFNPFFSQGALEPIESINPIEQEFVRSCWARVTIPVEDKDTGRLMNISSQYDENGKLINSPLSLLTPNTSRTDYLFRGASGITDISSKYRNFYVKETQVTFVVPDPVYFEQEFEPKFLRLKGNMVVEFGWGTKDNSIPIPLLTKESIPLLNDDTLSRNLKGGGHYNCVVGIVSNFDYSQNADGSYQGTITIFSGGRNVLATPISRGSFSDVVPFLQNKADLLNYNDKQKKEGKEAILTDEQEKELKNEIRKFKENSVSFKSVIANLESVVKSYLSDTEEIQINVLGSDKTTTSGDPILALNYQVKNGAMTYDVPRSSSNETSRNEAIKSNTYISWGWFEDFILNSFFSIQITNNKKTQTLNEFRSVTKTDEGLVDNKCKSNPNLYSIGFDSIILPGKFVRFPQVNLDTKGLGDNGKERITSYSVFNRLIDIFNNQYNFNAFEKFSFDDNKVGSIRDIVFNVEYLKEFFENIDNLEQGIRSFWADVSGNYGGFWDFSIVNDEDKHGRIGVVDLNQSSEPEPPQQTKLEVRSKKEDFLTYNSKESILKQKSDTIFTFPMFSKNSIVKDFSFNLNLSAEAATLAVYSANQSQEESGDSPQQVVDLGIRALGLLLNQENKDKNLKDNKQKVNELVSTKLSYPLTEKPRPGFPGLSQKQRGYSSDLKEKIVPELEQNGIDFFIPEVEVNNEIILSKIKEAKILEEKESYNFWFQDNTKVYFFDSSGKIYPDYKKTMLYKINKSLEPRDESNYTSVDPIIPIEVELTIDGISGLKPFDKFRVDYLPKVYRDNVYFVIFNIDHTISSTGWETKITGKMRGDIEAMKNNGILKLDTRKYITTEPEERTDLEGFIQRLKKEQSDRILKEAEENVDTLEQEDSVRGRFFRGRSGRSV